ncbi:uncharacterized protein LOC134236070 [Saccostrea cucullata]|uniref:uncharacterized protein LOC134236070 n=1 Tax=Saccostrea cuccullata TaxID=36930 RepID=UPI002ED49CD0
MRCLRRILGISWQDHVTNKDVLRQSGLPSLFALLSQRRLRWLGHVSRMDNGRIPKDVLYGELATGSRPTGRPVFRYNDVLKRDMRASTRRHAAPESDFTATAGAVTQPQTDADPWHDLHCLPRQKDANNNNNNNFIYSETREESYPK